MLPNYASEQSVKRWGCAPRAARLTRNLDGNSHMAGFYPFTFFGSQP